jgi:hypothetical protein
MGVDPAAHLRMPVWREVIHEEGDMSTEEVPELAILCRAAVSTEAPNSPLADST